MPDVVEKQKIEIIEEEVSDLHRGPVCPLCGDHSLETICHYPRIDRCLKCFHAFRTSPDNGIARSYSEKIAMPTFFEARMFARHHYDFIEKNIGFKRISSILEIGSGDGALLKLIRKKHSDIELFSVEPGKDLCRGLRQIPDLNVINAYIEETVFDRKFDLVIMSHVLEHVENPVEILRHIYDNLLDIGGCLYIDIPSQDFELASPKMASMAPATYLFFFNGSEFRRILIEAGFKDSFITGHKYSTIPKNYRKRMETISMLRNSNQISDKFRLFGNKALKKISLTIAAPVKTLGISVPREIPLEKYDSRYNNMAILAGK